MRGIAWTALRAVRSVNGIRPGNSALRCHQACYNGTCQSGCPSRPSEVRHASEASSDHARTTLPGKTGCSAAVEARRSPRSPQRHERRFIMLAMRRRTMLAAMAGGPAVANTGFDKRAADARRKRLYSLMGDLPARGRKISARIVSTEERPGFVLEKLVLDLNGLEPAPAWFVRPKQVKGAPARHPV